MGWIFLYAGLSKVLNPVWSASGFLLSAKTFPALYAMFANASIISTINFINEWSLVLLGVSLIIGAFVRLSSIGGIALMLLYYFPQLDFPYVGAYFLVDAHIIFILVLSLLNVSKSGEFLGLDMRLIRVPSLKRFIR